MSSDIRNIIAIISGVKCNFILINLSANILPYKLHLHALLSVGKFIIYTTHFHFHIRLASKDEIIL